LAAVWAERLTRRSIFEALKSRRTYALTGARIVLEVTVNGAPMGSEIELAHERTVKASAWAEAEIKKVEFMKNAEVAHAAKPGSDSVEVEWSETADDPAFYHVRVTQADGHLAVSSPVWVG
jgi:hypothetical protein